MSPRVRRIYDITLPLGPSLPIWPGDPPIAIEPASWLEKDGARVSRLALGTHSGTHIDAPAHLLEEGKDVSELELCGLVGPALVTYLPDVASIGIQELISAASTSYRGPGKTPLRWLFRTGNSDRGLLAQDFSPSYVSLTPDAAEWLVDQGVLLIGIDALSIDPFDDSTCAAHRILLAHDVIVVEGLDLREIAPGFYDLICLPLRIPGGDGAPARVVLVSRS